MCAYLYFIACLLGVVAAGTAAAEAEPDRLIHRPWQEARSQHFYIYSCGPRQEVARLAGRLEQFNQAYSSLAGTQAVASPPVVVLAFPDPASMRPFLPLYRGQPGNLAGFFRRGSDENLIVLPLSSAGTGSLETIFHEYAHLLLRRNQLVWPIWLHEGMADIYSTFQVTGDHSVRIGRSLEHYLHLLREQPLLPLDRLFRIKHDSPDYNERERQGVFYAQSWLLTHYLMIGNSSHRARFGQLTTLLRLGQSPSQAFVNAFQTSLPTMEKELQTYLERTTLQSLPLSVNANLFAPRALATRSMSPGEVCFRLGDELLRINRFEDAEDYFLKSRSLAPASPLASEGLGLLAAERNQSEKAIRQLEEALQRGSSSFLVHFIYAREKFRLTALRPDTYARIENPEAEEIRRELEKSLALMPDFGPAHQLFGFFEIVQGDDLARAETHLQKAIQLEPENPGYVLVLAQAQKAKGDLTAARRTLESLCLPYIQASIRNSAEELLKELH